MGKKVTPNFVLTIKHKKFSSKKKDANDHEGNAGYIQPPTKGHRYVIWINTDSSFLARIGTLFHEFGHFLFYTVFKEYSIDEDKEHNFCEKVDVAACKAFKEYLEE